MKIGLALSGGGVRGAAHIGILKALEENGIRPDYISGASAGSIVAALYSMGYSPGDIEEIFLKVGKKVIDYDFFGVILFATGMLLKRKVRIDGFLKGTRIEDLIEKLGDFNGINNFSKTKIPLAITAVDINNSDIVMFAPYSFPDNDAVYINSAKISEAVRSSISFPFIFKPKIINGRRLVDGGVRDNVPAKVLKKLGAQKVIGVNLGYCGEHKDEIDNVLEIVGQTIDVMAYSIFKYESDDIDVLLKPGIYDVKLLEVDRIGECIQRGYKYGCSVIPSVKSKLEQMNNS